MVRLYYLIFRKLTMLYDFIDINKNGGKPLYEQLYLCLKNAVANGTLRRGDKLPSIRKLSEDLSVSRTTVETAYGQLCAEGYIISRAKSGFFVEAEQDFDLPHADSMTTKNNSRAVTNTPVKYDFSSSSIDYRHIDIKFWKHCVKDVLDKHYIISSYGAAQGEEELRLALCDYSRSVRGVDAGADRIVIGAGTQPLLSVLLGLCGEYGKDVAIEKGFFPQGEQIFSDFGFTFTQLKADKNGIILDGVESRILFVNSSGSIRGSAPIPINKRHEIIRWAKNNNAIIIEDDFNGELRYTSKPVPALQGLDSDRVVYFGSFSKLLLPSVRIGYMVLPERLAEIYRQRSGSYNQTASKIEQLALAEYIRSGRMEKQLRKLRKVYGEKSNILLECLKNKFGSCAIIEVIETALCVRIKLKTPLTMEQLKKAAEENGIRLGKCREKNGLKYFYLSFSGLEDEKIPSAVECLWDSWEEARRAFNKEN